MRDETDKSVLKINDNFSGYPPGGPLLESFRNRMTRQFKSDLVQARPYKSMELRNV
jgi:hypothetical protein